MMPPYSVVREAKSLLSPVGTPRAASTKPLPAAAGPAAENPQTAAAAPPATRRRPVKRFSHNVSPLDPADHRSGVHSSEFRGMYNLAMITAGIYVFCTYVNNFVARGGILSDARLLVSVFYSWDFVEVLATFGAQVAFSYTAMVPVAMAASASPALSSRRAINIVHHVLQSVLFFFTSVFIVYRDWNTIHAVSSFVECLVLLMKMHSYIRTKLELARRDAAPPTQSLKDFTMYMLYPTLVYEPKFPRTEKIRWGYLTEKIVANTLAMSMLYIIVTDHVMPSLEDAGISNPVFVVLHLLLPFLGAYIMIWFIIFECVCNGIAEVTCMADRDFYGDWWNSTTFDEFARKWNKPVHEFLLRHVYLESLESYKLSRRNATTLTFFVSALIHECVFCIVFRTVKMYFFALQMLQVVVILYGRGLKNTRLGNYIFWCSMILGLPLQAVLYCREYHGGEPIFLNLMMPVMMAGFLGVACASLFMMGTKKKTTKTA